MLAYNSDPNNSAAAKARPDINRRTLKKVDEVIPMANSNVSQIDSQTKTLKNGEHPPRQRPAKPVPIRDLVHPSLNEPLKNQQQVTFRLIKAGKPSQKSFFDQGTSYLIFPKFQFDLHFYLRKMENIEQEKH